MKDCDTDTVLMKIEQVGVIACHTGRRSCFHRKHIEGGWQITDQAIRQAEAIYGKKHHE